MTGLTIGAVDSTRLLRATGQPFAMGPAARIALNEMARSGIIMAAFFAGYQCVKCGLSPLLESPQSLIMACSTVALAPFAALPPLRRLIPYGATLIAVDVYHSYWGASKQHRR